MKLYVLFVISQVVSYVLDRNACLLPSYLAVNEITRVNPDVKNSPHWVSHCTV